MQHKETKDTKYDRFKDTATKTRKSNMYLIGDPERYTTNIGKNYIYYTFEDTMENKFQKFWKTHTHSPDSPTKFNPDKLKDIFSTNRSGIAVHTHFKKHI